MRHTHILKLEWSQLYFILVQEATYSMGDTILQRPASKMGPSCWAITLHWFMSSYFSYTSPLLTHELFFEQQGALVVGWTSHTSTRPANSAPRIVKKHLLLGQLANLWSPMRTPASFQERGQPWWLIFAASTKKFFFFFHQSNHGIWLGGELLMQITEMSPLC